MGLLTLDGYHTQVYANPPMTFPNPASGYDQWLGDGYYFWEEEYFAKWWGQNKKCKGNTSRKYTIYKATLMFEQDEFIDTVFNEEDYYNFCHNIEKFAKKCQKNLGKKPTLEEFNQFLEDFKIWEDIKVIRFQDLPGSDEHIEVSGFYYKKRIQIRVKDPEIITKFVVLKTLGCI